MTDKINIYISKRFRVLLHDLALVDSCLSLQSFFASSVVTLFDDLCVCVFQPKFSYVPHIQKRDLTRLRAPQAFLHPHTVSCLNDHILRTDHSHYQESVYRTSFHSPTQVPTTTHCSSHIGIIYIGNNDIITSDGQPIF